MEHHPHIIHTGSVEVVKVDASQIAAVTEHPNHIRDIGSVEVGKIQAD